MKLRVGLHIYVDEISRRATAICSSQHCIKRMAGKRMAKSLKAFSMLIRIGLYWFPLAILVALVPAPATATNAITGKARVIDGDTIEMAGERIRLHGVDAPEDARVGVWRGEFMPPWEWRRSKR
jgi:hypothetical protein